MEGPGLVGKRTNINFLKFSYTNITCNLFTLLVPFGHLIIWALQSLCKVSNAEQT